jgi:hypothetical protein
MTRSSSFFQSTRSSAALYGAAIVFDELRTASGCTLRADRRSLLSRWVKRVSPSKGSNDNDDDPPPAPAGFGMPCFVPPLSRPMGERPESPVGMRR